MSNRFMMTRKIVNRPVFAHFAFGMARRLPIGLLLCVLAATPSAAELPFTAVWEAGPSLTVNTNRLRRKTQTSLAHGDWLFTYYNDIGGIPQDCWSILFDATTNAWRLNPCGAPDNFIYNCNESCPLSDSRVLYAGQLMCIKQAYLYDIESNTWTRAANIPLPSEIQMGDLFARSNGEALYHAITTSSKAYRIYDSISNKWRTANIELPLTLTESLVLPDTRIWSCANAGYIDCFIDLDPDSLTWDLLGVAPSDVALIDFMHEKNLARWNDSLVYTCRPNTNTTRIEKINRAGETSVLGTRSENDAAFLHATLLSFNAAGRDWLVQSYRINPTTHAFKVYDEDTGSWVDLPNCSIPDILYYHIWKYELPDGLLACWIGQNGLESARLRITEQGGGEPVPPQVSSVLPVAINLDEGLSTNFSYSVIGDIPTNGVDVVVERVSGDGDIRILDGAQQHIASRFESKTVHVVALPDIDATDDQAILRLCVLQEGGGTDPNARTIPVTVRDLYEVNSHMLGDVNSDGYVNALDLDEVVRNFGKSTND